VLAVATWAWAVAAGVGLIALGMLVLVALALLGRLKELRRTVAAASEEVRGALAEVRGELDRMAEGLASLRERGKEPEGG
jgi:Sec-independent protein translocase protein TatA